MTPTRMADWLDLLIEDARWRDAGLARMAETGCAATLAHFGLPPERFEISLLGCDDARIAVLNAEFREKPAPTNVLSWPARERGAAQPGAAPDLPRIAPDGPPEELGDIAISYDTCAREARDFGRDFEFHATHLLVHATLHLLGYDHISPPDARLMEGIEREILARSGFGDPYEDA